MKDHFLQIVKQTIRQVEPDAEVVFFGSRRRGDAAENADWDFLIVVNGFADERRKDAIRYELFNVELDHGQVINSVIVGQDLWNSPQWQAAPLHKNIQSEGVAL